MRVGQWGILHHWALGKLNSMGSWCTLLSDYMGGSGPRKSNSMGGWVKKSAVSPPGVFFWNSPKWQSEFAILRGFYFHETSQNKTLSKISEFTVYFPCLHF